MIVQKPIFGWGAAAFSIIYPLRFGVWVGHSHNLFLEFAVANGLFCSFILLAFIFLMIFSSYKKIFNDNYIAINIIDRAWWTSSFLFFFIHLTDITLFDFRINILIWILLAGLRMMLISS